MLSMCALMTRRCSTSAITWVCPNHTWMHRLSSFLGNVARFWRLLKYGWRTLMTQPGNFQHMQGSKQSASSRSKYWDSYVANVERSTYKTCDPVRKHHYHFATMYTVLDQGWSDIYVKSCSSTYIRTWSRGISKKYHPIVFLYSKDLLFSLIAMKFL